MANSSCAHSTRLGSSSDSGSAAIAVGPEGGEGGGTDILWGDSGGEVVVESQLVGLSSGSSISERKNVPEKEGINTSLCDRLAK